MSLADFISPDPAFKSTIGIFCLKVSDAHKCTDCPDFNQLIRESLCARLTEALAEWMHEQLSEGLHMIRPAFGYPACPDHSLKKEVFQLLNAPADIGVELTSSYAIIPTTSLCGMLIAHPQARYFNVTKISSEQFHTYCQQRGFSPEEGKRLLGPLIDN